MDSISYHQIGPLTLLSGLNSFTKLDSSIKVMAVFLFTIGGGSETGKLLHWSSRPPTPCHNMVCPIRVPIIATALPCLQDYPPISLPTCLHLSCHASCSVATASLFPPLPLLQTQLCPSWKTLSYQVKRGKKREG